MDTPAESSAPQPAEPSFEEQELADRHRRRVRKIVAIVAAVVVVTGGFAWVTDGFSRSPRGISGLLAPPCPPTVALNGSGSTFIAPLMQTWVHAYSGAAASRSRGCVVVQPTYTASSSAAALGTLGAGGTEFVATEEPLSPAEEAGLPEATLTLPLAASAVAVAYNVAGMPAGLNLTGAILAEIYLGTITFWNDSAIAAVNPGVSLPAAAPISVIHDGPGSSTSYVFTGFLSASNGTWAADVGQGSTVTWPTGVVANGDANVSALLASTPGGIAYLGLGSAVRSGLTLAKVENPNGFFVAPSATSVFAAASAYDQTLPLGNESWQGVSLLDQPGNTSYPISTFTYGIVYVDLGHAYNGVLPQNVAQWLAAFLYWMSVAGQSYGTSLGYAPFSQTVTNANQQIVELLRYDGIPALGDIDYDGD